MRRARRVTAGPLDGGTASMLVASEVPVSMIGWFHDYATGQGYAARRTAGQRLGPTVVVNATILPNGQIRVRLVPQVSYSSPQGDGSIEFSEVATEVIVPDGRPMRIAGATRGMNQVTRQILGYRGSSPRARPVSSSPPPSGDLAPS